MSILQLAVTGPPHKLASGRPYGKWSDVEQSVLTLAQTLCAPDTMPSYMAMRTAGACVMHVCVHMALCSPSYVAMRTAECLV